MGALRTAPSRFCWAVARSWVALRTDTSRPAVEPAAPLWPVRAAPLAAAWLLVPDPLTALVDCWFCRAPAALSMRPASRVMTVEASRSEAMAADRALTHAVTSSGLGPVEDGGVVSGGLAVDVAVEVGVGVSVLVGVGVLVAVLVAVGVAVGVGVAVWVGLAVAVGVGVGEGLGEPPPTTGAQAAAAASSRSETLPVAGRSGRCRRPSRSAPPAPPGRAPPELEVVALVVERRGRGAGGRGRRRGRRGRVESGLGRDQVGLGDGDGSGQRVSAHPREDLARAVTWSPTPTLTDGHDPRGPERCAHLVDPLRPTRTRRGTG